ELPQPCFQRVRPATQPGREVRNLVLPHVKGGKELSGLVVKVTHKIWICIRETGSTSGEAALRDEVGEQPDPSELETGVGTETIDSAWDGDLVANHDVVQRLPAAHGQEWMVAGDLNKAARSCGHFETRFDAAVDPGGDSVGLDSTVPTEAVNTGDLSLDCLFDRQ